MGGRKDERAGPVPVKAETNAGAARSDLSKNTSRFFPFLFVFVFLTPAQEHKAVLFLGEPDKAFASFLFPFLLPLPLSLLFSPSLSVAFVAFPTEPLHCNAPTVLQNNKGACFGPHISLSVSVYIRLNEAPGPWAT